MSTFYSALPLRLFSITSGTLFFYQNVALIEVYKYVNNAENGILDFHRVWLLQV